MIKGICFTSGIIGGIYFGIYLREQGYVKSLTRAFHAFRDEDYGKAKVQRKDPGIDEVFDHFNKGLLKEQDLDKFYDMTMKKDYTNAKEIVRDNIDSIMKGPQFENYRKEKNLLGKD